jgi:hypothetical protein
MPTAAYQQLINLKSNLQMHTRMALKSMGRSWWRVCAAQEAAGSNMALCVCVVCKAPEGGLALSAFFCFVRTRRKVVCKALLRAP